MHLTGYGFLIRMFEDFIIPHFTGDQGINLQVPAFLFLFSNDERFPLSFYF